MSRSTARPAIRRQSRVACQYAPTHRVAQVHETAIREASALVASQQFPGIYWTLNDSGNTPMIFAFDQDGASRGSFRVTGATNVDWEAMQLGPDGDGGFALYIGDTGDNDQMRRDPVVYRVPEPEPAEAGDTALVGRDRPGHRVPLRLPRPLAQRRGDAGPPEDRRDHPGHPRGLWPEPDLPPAACRSTLAT